MITYCYEIRAHPREAAVSGDIDAKGIQLLKGVRGKFCQANAKLNLPVYLDKEVLSFVLRIAEKRKSDLSSIANELLRKDMQLADALK